MQKNEYSHGSRIGESDREGDFRGFLTQNYAVIPVKKFDQSKQRLTSLLTGKEREGLTFHLLFNMLTKLQASNVDTIVLVAANSEDTVRIAPAFPKLRVVGESVKNGGVNSAMQDGLRLIPSSKSKVLLFPSDLPLITTSAINRALEMLDDNNIIINPSKRKDGTNLLGFWSNKVIELHYDDNSVTKHLEEIRKERLKFQMIEWREFLTDVDDPEDLKDLSKLFRVGNLSELIEKIGDLYSTPEKP